MVVIHHARNPRPWLFNPLHNYNQFASGVDIFFLISGFIMYVAARTESPARFTWKRVSRIVPLYWLATLTLFASRRGLNIFSIPKPEIKHIIYSLLFIPQYSPEHPGQIVPYPVPGWSLNYEIFFYFIFAFALLIKRPLLAPSCIIIFLVTLGALGPQLTNPIWKIFTDAKMLEFLAGIWIGYLYAAGGLKSGLTSLAPSGFLGLFLLGNYSVIATILFCSMILIGAVAYSTTAPKIGLLSSVGDSSYSIYLSHGIIGLYISRTIVAELPLTGWSQFLTLITISLVTSVLVGGILYNLLEKPLLRFTSPSGLLRCVFRQTSRPEGRES